MSDPETKPLARTPWVLGVVSVLGFIVIGGLTDGQRHLPAELRWANGDIKPELGSHFKTVSNYELTDSAGVSITGEQSVWNEPNVAVYTTPSARRPPAPVTLETLSDAGQAHAIDFIAKDAVKADAAWQQLSKTLSGPEGSVEHRDPYRADRVLVATVAKGLAAMPGDRLLWTRVFVRPINFKFAGYTAAATEAKTVKIASIANSNTAKLSLGFALGAVVPGSKDAEAPSAEASNKASTDINQQYESLGVDIRPQFLRIIRESATGGDVVGNTLVELSMLTDPTLILAMGHDPTLRAAGRDTPALVVDEAQLTDGLQYLDPPKAKITVHPQDVLPHCPLIAEVWMMYEQKKVTAGGDHYLEGLQTVKLTQDGEVKQTVEIVPADDIAPAVWSIKRQTTEPDPGQAPDLRASVPGGTRRRVVSTDYLTMSELTHWLKSKGPGHALSSMGFDYAEGDTLVPFKNVSDDCRKQQ